MNDRVAILLIMVVCTAIFLLYGVFLVLKGDSLGWALFFPYSLVAGISIYKSSRLERWLKRDD